MSIMSVDGFDWQAACFRRKRESRYGRERQRGETACRARIFSHLTCKLRIYFDKTEFVIVGIVETLTKTVLVSFILFLSSLNEVCFTTS